MNNRKVIITGGSGFIGTALMDELVNCNYQVINFDIQAPMKKKHKKYWRDVNILNREHLIDEVKNSNAEYFVHLAARTDLDEADSMDGYKVNIEGVKNVCDAINSTPSITKTIIASSMLVCRVGYIPSNDLDYTPPNLYAKSKVLTEQITRSSGLKSAWTIIRPTTIWGPWSLRYRDHFFSVLQKGMYIHPGRNKIMKTYGFVGNSAFQIRRLLEVDECLIQGKTFYLGDPAIDLYDWVNRFSLRLRGKEVFVAPYYILKLIAKLGDTLSGFNMQFPLTSFRLSNMTPSNVLDVDSLIQITGTLPYSLDDGVKLTVEWLTASRKDREA